MRRVVMANFAVDSAALKPEHEEWLLNAHLDGSFDAVRIDIVGYASRSGPLEENAALSMQRARAIHAAINPGGFDPPIEVNLSGQGESQSPAADGTECAADRAVEMMISPAPQSAGEFEPDEVVGRERDGPLLEGFHLRPCPPTWMLHTREADDAILRAVAAFVESAAVSEATLNMAAGASPGRGAAAELLTQGVNAGQASMSVTGGRAGTLGVEDPRIRALNQKIWTDYSHRLAERGLGFDKDYWLIDRNGVVVDDWWHDRIQ